MDKERLEEALSGLSPVLKKELLGNLVNSLLSDLNEAEKKSLIQTIVTGRKGSCQLVERALQ